MTDERKTQVRGRDLWANLAREGAEDPEVAGLDSGPLSGMDANLLAAYLDGTLSERERETLEARMADQPALLETVLAARGPAVDVAAPAPLIAAAKEAASAPSRPRPQIVPRPANENRGGKVAWLEWAVAAAALVAVCTVGFQMGSETGRGAPGGTVVAAKGSVYGFDLEGTLLTAGFSLEEADDVFNGGE